MPDHARTPRRVRLPDFAGRVLSLPDAPEAWERLGSGAALLLLGLGPGRAWELPFARGTEVFWLEEAETLRRLEAERPGTEGRLPGHWRRITAEQAVELAGRCSVRFYRPGLRLAPDFWGPLLGRLGASLLAEHGAAVKTAEEGGRGPALLPGTERQLLHLELRQALGEAGFEPVLETLPPRGDEAHLLLAWEQLLAGRRPALLLSVNLRGLDPEGRIFYLCRALGVPVAIWFVDNPWQLLSSLRLPWWREAALFVTDASFIPGLRAAGARRVWHLPLAVAPQMWRDMPDEKEAARLALHPPLFVGRSAFPGRERFFAAARVPRPAQEEALSLLERASGPADGPHFHWWLQKLAASPWPGQEARCAGLGAELCSQGNRARWVRAGLAAGMRVVGDAGWRELLPGCDVLPPVDYYRELPECYGRAGAVLNVTSLLLPQSLSQRHFDVWAAGGLLLSDATPGLDIFPSALTRPMTLRDPADLPRRLAVLRADPAQALELRRNWRERLRAAHTYAHRVARIREVLDV
ncbi:glycosyltransferase family protein [Desulfovibrio sp. SGI.169]|uniref:glycosyltransferase family protein n=1 Tax=Desulfovibrio sp. SGI.169 TaxID=3420561 RepID=UPI003D015FD1